MSHCDHCTTDGHEPAGCANRAVPMIHRSCTCGCDRTDFDPAPYWTALDQAADDQVDDEAHTSGEDAAQSAAEKQAGEEEG